MYITLDQTYFERPQELIDLVNTSKLVQKYFPRQTDIDKIFNVIKRKVLKGTHLLLTIEEIQEGYLTSPISRIYTDIWLKIFCQGKGV